VGRRWGVARDRSQVAVNLDDAASRRTRITWPDAFYAVYDYDVAGDVTAIRENGATSGAGVLATYGYDNLGRRTSVSRGNGVSSAYAFSNSHLSSLSHDLSGTSQDQSYAYTRNALGDIIARDGSNDAYDFMPLSAGTTSYADNGLNQYTSVGGVSQSYDARANLTTGGFGYDAQNRLTSAGSASFGYDPEGRLYQSSSAGATTRFLYDGLQIIGEYNGSGALQRRFVPGLGLDDTIVWYEGGGASDRRWLLPDERGSVIAITNASGAATTINTYDEYGIPGSGNQGRFQYAGYAWLPEASLHHLRARAYSPTLGRFLQPDPILYAGGMNLYAYVGDNPIGRIDPLGLMEFDVEDLRLDDFGVGGFGLNQSDGRRPCEHWLVDCHMMEVRNLSDYTWVPSLGGGTVAVSSEIIVIGQRGLAVPRRYDSDGYWDERELAHCRSLEALASSHAGMALNWTSLGATAVVAGAASSPTIVGGLVIGSVGIFVGYMAAYNLDRAAMYNEQRSQFGCPARGLR
jgi:RHS repeat-associated protein